MIKMMETPEIKVFQIKQTINYTENFEEEILKLWPDNYKYIISFFDITNDIEYDVYQTYVRVNKLYISGQFKNLERQLLCGDLIFVNGECFAVADNKFVHINKNK